MYSQETVSKVQRYANPSLSKTPSNSTPRNSYNEKRSQYEYEISTFLTPMTTKRILNPLDVTLDSIKSPRTHRRNLDARVAKLLERCDNAINTNNIAAKNTQNLLSNL